MPGWFFGLVLLADQKIKMLQHILISVSPSRVYHLVFQFEFNLKAADFFFGWQKLIFCGNCEENWKTGNVIVSVIPYLCEQI